MTFNPDPYTTLPAGWGVNYEQALLEASERRVNVNLIGQSISSGFNASAKWSTAWWSLIRGRIQARFGDGGAGYRSVQNSPSADPYGPFEIEELGGAWTPLQSGLGITLSGANGRTLRYPAIRGRDWRLMVQPIDAARSNALWILADRVALQETREGALVAGPVQWRPPTDVRGERIRTPDGAYQHAVTVSGPGSGATIAAIDGVLPTGVAVHNFSRASQQFAYWLALSWGLADPPGNRIVDWIGRTYRPDLLVIGDAPANDWFAGVPIGTMQTNLRALIDAQLAFNDRLDVVIQIAGVSQWANDINSAAIYQQYVDATYTVAAEYDAAVIDTWARWQEASGYAEAQGFIDRPSDPVHPVDLGHEDMAAQIGGVLVPSL